MSSPSFNHHQIRSNMYRFEYLISKSTTLSRGHHSRPPHQPPHQRLLQQTTIVKPSPTLICTLLPSSTYLTSQMVNFFQFTLSPIHHHCVRCASWRWQLGFSVMLMKRGRWWRSSYISSFRDTNTIIATTEMQPEVGEYVLR